MEVHTVSCCEVIKKFQESPADSERQGKEGHIPNGLKLLTLC